jgi:hypothetical protein
LCPKVIIALHVSRCFKQDDRGSMTKEGIYTLLPRASLKNNRKWPYTGRSNQMGTAAQDKETVEYLVRRHQRSHGILFFLFFSINILFYFFYFIVVLGGDTYRIL